MYQPKAVVLLSGGLDSATTAAIAKTDGYEVIALSFRYGQRHERELTAASRIAEVLEISKHYIVDVNLGDWGGSSLTDRTINLPTDGIDPDIIPSTYVPGRNTVFIAIALSLAEAQGASSIYLGINAVDYSGYPDCRPAYLEAYQNLIALSSKVGIEGNSIQLIAPLVRNSKIDIVRQAIALGVPINETWSCYQGDIEPCGVCDSCRLRDEALIAAGYPELATAVGRRLHKLP
jgi:7-cyano-7-deazaguanine synthase